MKGAVGRRKFFTHLKTVHGYNMTPLHPCMMEGCEKYFASSWTARKHKCGVVRARPPTYKERLEAAKAKIGDLTEKEIELLAKEQKKVKKISGPGNPEADDIKVL